MGYEAGMQFGRQTDRQTLGSLQLEGCEPLENLSWLRVGVLPGEENIAECM